MESLVGQTLNRYRLEALLGQGGMGAVYKAHDVTLQRDVAVKVMHANIAGRADFQDRFLQEARAAARLHHPGIVQVHDFGVAEPWLFIVMEFIPGDNLSSMLSDLRRAGQWIPLTEAVELVRQVALTLDYAHRRGVLHRDIKPANLMLRPEPAGPAPGALTPLPYQPVVTDLGLARLAGSGMQTEVGVSMGTPAYMSPEQALGKQVDARSDVYSLGILLFELAVGRLPFDARTLTEAVRAHTQEPPPAPRRLRPELPVALETIILKALAKRPGDRYPDSASLASALADIAGQTTQVTPGETQASLLTPGGVVSLATQYQQSLLAPRGLSVFPAESPDAGTREIALQIQPKNGPARLYPLPPEVVAGRRPLLIGREADNDLVLEDTRVSRHHARLENSDTQWRVTDLGSSNGTYLANAPLLADVPEDWSPDVPLRVGDTWLRLLPAEQAAGAQSVGYAQTYGISSSGASGSRPGNVHTSSGAGRVGVALERDRLRVAPGETARLAITLINQSELVDHFLVTLPGLPDSWLQFPPPVRLLPGNRQEIQVEIKPPRSPASRAGDYPFQARVTSQAAPDQVAAAPASLQVTPYQEFNSQLFPQQVNAGKPVRLTVSNRGNADQKLQVSFQDRADELLFTPPTSDISVPPGGESTVEFSARPKQRRWIGGEQRHNFSVTLEPQGGAPHTQTGELLSRALLPAWVIPALFTLCCLLAGAAGLLYNAQTTRLAQATQTAAVFQTAIAISARDAAQATNAAQTAAAQAGDDDGDGLSNQEELANNTDPRNPDTDGDGLDDNAELRIFSTNPRQRDTDGDTLPDGMEVNELNTSPTNVDTDGDGLNDNVDPAPGELPTLTPTATETPQPTSTPTPTATPTPTFTPTQPRPTAFGGGSGRLAFYSNIEGNNEIFLINGDGTGRVNLTQNPANEYSPSMSPDGRRVAFLSDRGGQLDLYVIDTNGENLIRLTNDSLTENNPAWSPNGRFISFDRLDGGDEQSIFTVPSDGSDNPEVLIEGGSQATWAPDGQRVAFVSSRSGSQDIYVADIDGNNQRRLTLDRGEERLPDWQPGGELIIFEASGSGLDIWQIMSDGTGLLNLTEDFLRQDFASNEFDPAWSADGNFIVFESDMGADYEIFRMNASGGDVVNLTNATGNDYGPDW